MTSQMYLSIVFSTVLLAAFFVLVVVKPIMKTEYAKKAMSDISAVEMNNLEIKLSNFLKQNNLEPGVSVFEVAKVLRVQDQGSVEDINSRARIYDPDHNGIKNVVHNRRVPNSEWLFDFAHELGHQINGDDTPADRPLGSHKPKIDQLADYTGAALLMPLEHVYKYLLENNYEASSNRRRILIIKKLCRKYRVSEMVAVRRVNEVRMLKK